MQHEVMFMYRVSKTGANIPDSSTGKFDEPPIIVIKLVTCYLRGRERRFGKFDIILHGRWPGAVNRVVQVGDGIKRKHLDKEVKGKRWPLGRRLYRQRSETVIKEEIDET